MGRDPERTNARRWRKEALRTRKWLRCSGGNREDREVWSVDLSCGRQIEPAVAEQNAFRRRRELHPERRRCVVRSSAIRLWSWVRPGLVSGTRNSAPTIGCGHEWEKRADRSGFSVRKSLHHHSNRRSSQACQCSRSEGQCRTLRPRPWPRKSPPSPRRRLKGLGNKDEGDS